MDLFYSNVSDCEYHIVALSETWLKPEVNSSELFPEFYNVFRSDRKYDVLDAVSGGGVLFAVDATLQCDLIDSSHINIKFPEIDFLVIKCYSYINVFIYINVN